MLCTLHGAGRYCPCVSRVISFESLMHSTKRPSRLLAARTETRRLVQSLRDSWNSERLEPDAVTWSEADRDSESAVAAFSERMTVIFQRFEC